LIAAQQLAVKERGQAKSPALGESASLDLRTAAATRTALVAMRPTLIQFDNGRTAGPLRPNSGLVPVAVRRGELTRQIEEKDIEQQKRSAEPQPAETAIGAVDCH